jgi:hypothetical protein
MTDNSSSASASKSESKGDTKASQDPDRSSQLAAKTKELVQLQQKLKTQAVELFELQQAEWKEVSSDADFAKLPLAQRWKRFAR